MRRALRVQFAEAIFHLMSRADHRQSTFGHDRNRQALLGALGEGRRRRSYHRPSRIAPVEVAVLLLFGLVSAARAQAPTIVKQPQSQVVRLGGTARFSVGATGSVPLVYHWLFNGSNLVALTNPVLTLAAVRPEQAGEYSVTVSNSFGASEPSAQAFLTICSPVQFVGSNVNVSVSNLFSSSVFSFDATGNLFLARVVTDLEVMKLDRSAQIVWDIHHTEPGLSGFSRCAIATAPDGSVVVAAEGDTGFTAMFDQDGRKQWSSNCAIGLVPMAVTVNQATNVFAAGYSSNGYFVLKQDATGDLLWVTTYPGAFSQGSPIQFVLGSDSAGNVVVGSHFQYSTNLTVAKFGPTGELLWQTVAPVLPEGNVNSLAMTMNPAGDAYITCSFDQGTTASAGNLTVKVSGEGQVTWFAYHPRTASGRQTVTAVDSFGNFYCVVERYPGITTEKYDPAGIQRWSITGPLSGSACFPHAAFVDAAGTVWVGGSLLRSNLFFVLFVATFEQHDPPGLPVIVENPQSYRVLPGASVTFRSRAIGAEPVSCQWRLNGDNILNATNTTLMLSNVQVADGGDYSALVTNPEGCAVTRDGKLTVVEMLPFGFRGVTLSNGILVLRLFGESNRLYSLEQSSDLRSWRGSFGFRPLLQEIVLGASDSNAQFYRLQTQP